MGGLIITFFGILSIAAGDWVGHPGGIYFLVVGIALGSGGALASKWGLRIQRDIEA